MRYMHELIPLSMAGVAEGKACNICCRMQTKLLFTFILHYATCSYENAVTVYNLDIAADINSPSAAELPFKFHLFFMSRRHFCIFCVCPYILGERSDYLLQLHRIYLTAAVWSYYYYKLGADTLVSTCWHS